MGANELLGQAHKMPGRGNNGVAIIGPLHNPKTNKQTNKHVQLAYSVS